MDVSFLDVRRDRLPDLHLRVQPLDLAPCGVTDALAVGMWRDKQELQLALLTINLDDSAADFLLALHYAIGASAVNRVLNSFTRDDLSIFFEMVVPTSELLRPTIVEVELN